MRSALRAIEIALWLVAAATLGYCGYSYGYSALHQEHEKALFANLQVREAKEASYWGSAAASGAPDPGKLLGILVIPRIGLSAVVDRGDDAATLRLGVGHVPGTALPGQTGNAALAAHRDTFFRHLYKLRPGDTVIFRSISATYRYKVRSARVVAPTDTAVLNPTPQRTLTLITCFPFYYVGSAPKRFVLVARQMSLAPSAPEGMDPHLALQPSR